MSLHLTAGSPSNFRRSFLTHGLLLWRSHRCTFSSTSWSISTDISVLSLVSWHPLSFCQIWVHLFGYSCVSSSNVLLGGPFVHLTLCMLGSKGGCCCCWVDWYEESDGKDAGGVFILADEVSDFGVSLFMRLCHVSCHASSSSLFFSRVITFWDCSMNVCFLSHNQDL